MGRKTALFAYFYAASGQGKLHSLEPQKLKGKTYATCKKKNWQIKGCPCIANPAHLWDSWFTTEAELCYDFALNPAKCGVGGCDWGIATWNELYGFVCAGHQWTGTLKKRLLMSTIATWNAPYVDKREGELAGNLAPELQSRLEENNESETTEE
jgi:hypothetical protein